MADCMTIEVDYTEECQLTIHTYSADEVGFYTPNYLF